MKKFTLCLIFMLFCSPSFAANAWRDDSTDFLDGDSVLFNDVDTEISDHIIEPLDRILTSSRNGMLLEWSSAAQISVSEGAVVCSNAGGTLNKIRRNTSATTVTWADIDTGAEASSTTYYVWAVADADATTATFKISTSSSAPTGATYYKRIGSFYNDASSNISYYSNFNGVSYEANNASPISEGTSYTAGTEYQNTTNHKLLIVAYLTSVLNGGWTFGGISGQIGTASAGTTVANYNIYDNQNWTEYGTITFVVPVGWYWKVTNYSVSGNTGTVSRIEAWEL